MAALSELRRGFAAAVGWLALVCAIVAAALADAKCILGKHSNSLQPEAYPSYLYSIGSGSKNLL